MPRKGESCQDCGKNNKSFNEAAAFDAAEGYGEYQ